MADFSATIWSYSGTIYDLSSGVTDNGFRVVLNASVLNGTYGSIKLKFMHAGSDYTLDEIWVWRQDPGGDDPYDALAGSGVQVTVGGSTSPTITSNGTLSDAIAFPVNGSQNIIVCCSTQSTNFPAIETVTGVDSYFIGATEQCDTGSVPSLYSHTIYDCFFIYAILGDVETTPSASPSGTPSASPSEATPSSSPSEATPSGSPSSSPSEATPSSSPSEATPSASPSEATPSASPSASPSGSPSASQATPSEATPSSSPSASPSEGSPSCSWAMPLDIDPFDELPCGWNLATNGDEIIYYPGSRTRFDATSGISEIIAWRLDDSLYSVDTGYWFKLKVNFQLLSDLNAGDRVDIFYAYDIPYTASAFVSYQNTYPTGYVNKWLIQHGTGSSNDYSVELDSNGAINYLWIYLKSETSEGAGDGILRLYRNTVDVFGSSNLIAEVTNGGVYYGVTGNPHSAVGMGLAIEGYTKFTTSVGGYIDLYSLTITDEPPASPSATPSSSPSGGTPSGSPSAATPSASPSAASPSSSPSEGTPSASPSGTVPIIETFESIGYDIAWTIIDNGAAPLDPNYDNSLVSGTPTGWGDQSLRAEIASAGDESFIERGLLDLPDSYLSFEVLFDSLEVAEYNFIGLAWVAGGIKFLVYAVAIVEDGGEYYFSIIANDDGGFGNYYQSNVAVDLRTAYKVEVEWNATGDEWSWRINGVPQLNNIDGSDPITSSGTLTGAHPLSVNDVAVGLISADEDAEVVAYFDNIQVGTEGYSDPGATPSEATPSSSPSVSPSATPSDSPSEATPSSSPSAGSPSVTPSVSPKSPSASPSHGTPSGSPSAGSPSGTPSEGSPSASPTEGSASASPTEGSASSSPSSSPSEGTPSSSPSAGTPSGTPSDSPSASPSGVTVIAYDLTTRGLLDTVLGESSGANINVAGDLALYPLGFSYRIDNVAGSLALPGLEIDSTIGVELSLAGTLALPILGLDAIVTSYGAVAGDLALPGLEIDAAVSVSMSVSATLDLPSLELSAYTYEGIELEGTVALPVLGIDARFSFTGDPDEILLNNIRGGDNWEPFVYP